MTPGLATSLEHAGLAARLLVLDWTAAHQPDMLDLERGLAYPPRRPSPLNLNLCSSCEVGSHDLCPSRIMTGLWRAPFDCACLCRYADQGLPAPRRKPTRP